mgnify:CR=1 FL=1
MNQVATENAEFRKNLFVETGARMKIPAAFVEKDFWVCWTLGLLFGDSSLKEHLIFKGGTSLSKVFGIIIRFSEDIDLTVDRRLFGFGDELNPNNAPSNKKRKKLVKDMVEASRTYIQGALQTMLNQAIDDILSASSNLDWDIQIDPDVKDGQSLLFHYPLCGLDYGDDIVSELQSLEQKINSL